MNIKVKRVKEAATIPTKVYKEDAGWDLYSPQKLSIYPGWSAKIDLGLCFEIPEGWFGKIEDRSSVAMQEVYTSGGVIDSLYRGEVSVLLRNKGVESYRIDIGSRIAQMLILPVPSIEMNETKELTQTKRGLNGWGSTGR